MKNESSISGKEMFKGQLAKKLSTNRANFKLMEMATLERATECFRTIAHPCRLRMIEMLLVEERSVGELASACKIPGHMASEHLRLLKDRGLLRNRREGRKVFYSVADPMLANIIDCVDK